MFLLFNWLCGYKGIGKLYFVLICYVIFCIDEKFFCMKRNVIFFKNSYVFLFLKEIMYKILMFFIILWYELVIFW